ncbi:hypothetical protein ASF61_05610 [Duganella sp. Leaf126]|nr:hypothetical protein ASF61_05610 [Duganella sp. Leaf126]
MMACLPSAPSHAGHMIMPAGPHDHAAMLAAAALAHERAAPASRPVDHGAAPGAYANHDNTSHRYANNSYANGSHAKGSYVNDRHAEDSHAEDSHAGPRQADDSHPSDSHAHGAKCGGAGCCIAGAPLPAPVLAVPALPAVSNVIASYSAYLPAVHLAHPERPPQA